MIDDAVFPALQGGPHNHSGVATQLLEVASDEFRDYSKKVIENAKLLGKELVVKGFNLSSDGTDNHLLLVNLRNFGVRF